MSDKINKDYITFYVGDGGDRESASVYYARVVSASSKRSAIKKFIINWDGLSNSDTIPESRYNDFDAKSIKEIRLN
jgi:mevalonate pyrophosphate decarboxylase